MGVSLMGIHRRQKLVLILVLFFILYGLGYFIFYYSIFVIISDTEIIQWLVSSEVKNTTNLCPIPTNEDVPQVRSDIKKSAEWRASNGGEWSPSCRARFLVALVVPYRDRAEHLTEFIQYIRPFLQHQNVHYKIYVVEQADTKKFNRGKLFNVGFVEALKEKHYPCFIFHDVDLLPENMKNIYACTNYPRHMASSIDKFNYRIPYERNFGGVTSILTDQFRFVNGFSNRFYGWGGEDDDFLNRVLRVGLPVIRFTPNVSRYRSLDHKKAAASHDRYDKLKEGQTLHNVDGLNSLSYVLKKKILAPGYVKLLIEL